MLLGDRLIEHKKRNRIRLLGRYLDYPLSLGNLLPLLGPVRAAKFGLGYAAAMAGGLLRRQRARVVRGLHPAPVRARRVRARLRAAGLEGVGRPAPALRGPGQGAHPLGRRHRADPAPAEAQGEHAGRGRAVLLLPARRLRRVPRAPGGGDPPAGRPVADRGHARGPRARRPHRQGGAWWRRRRACSAWNARRWSRPIPMQALAGLLFPGDARGGAPRRARCACATWRSSTWSSTRTAWWTTTGSSSRSGAIPSTASSSRRPWTTAWDRKAAPRSAAT